MEALGIVVDDLRIRRAAVKRKRREKSNEHQPQSTTEPNTMTSPQEPAEQPKTATSTSSTNPISSGTSLIPKFENDELKKKVKSFESYLKNIKSSREFCERHNMYFGTERSKRSLDSMMRVDKFSEEQTDVIMDEIMVMFPVASIKDMDYILRVLFPETVTKLLNENKSHSDSQVVGGNASFILGSGGARQPPSQPHGLQHSSLHLSSPAPAPHHLATSSHQHLDSSMPPTPEDLRGMPAMGHLPHLQTSSTVQSPSDLGSRHSQSKSHFSKESDRSLSYNSSEISDSGSQYCPSSHSGSASSDDESFTSPKPSTSKSMPTSKSSSIKPGSDSSDDESFTSPKPSTSKSMPTSKSSSIQPGSDSSDDESFTSPKPSTSKSMPTSKSSSIQPGSDSSEDESFTSPMPSTSKFIPTCKSSSTKSTSKSSFPCMQKQTQSQSHRKLRKECGTAKRIRSKLVCPQPGCRAEGYENIKKHYLSCHKDIPLSALPRKSTSESVRQKRLWKCPEQHCTWAGDRLDKHLCGKNHRFLKTEAKVKAADERQRQTQNVCEGVPRKVPTSKTNADSLVKNFYQFYTSFEGGHFIPDFVEPSKRKEREEQSKKVMRMVRTVLQTTFGETDFELAHLNDLANIGKGSPSVVEKLAETRAWCTVRNMLHAYTHFINFLAATHSSFVNVAALRSALDGCLKSVWKISQEEVQRRKLRDRNEILNWQHMCSYISSAPAFSLYEEYKSLTSHKERVKMSLKIQRHILLLIAIQNAKRTGSFVDLTLKEFKEAEKKGDGFVVFIAEGKTFRTSGSANCYFSEDEYRLIERYIDECRSIHAPSTDQLFCLPCGRRSCVRYVKRQLDAAWKEFGEEINEDTGDITCRLIRKTIVSRSREVGVPKATKEIMARHMDHQEATADSHYDVSTGTMVTTSFRNIVNRLLQDESLQQDEDSSESDSDGSDGEAVAPSQEFESSTTSNENKPTASKPTPKPQTTKSNFGHPSVFSDQDSLRVKTACKSLIIQGSKKHITVTRAGIIRAIKEAGPNFSDLLTRYTTNQLSTKVRTEVKKVGKYKA